jgi:alanine or glycine:cation symporter, AGCS family
VRRSLFLFQALLSLSSFYVLFPALILLGGYLSVRLRFLQLSKLYLSFRHLIRNQGSKEGGIPRYQAVATVLAGNFGTGNISGMAVALSTGGPGALVWMWVMAFLGVIVQYASCLLAVKYRDETPNGEFSGGPMLYLKKGLGSPLAAGLFALSVMLGAITVGGFCQMHSMCLALEGWNIPGAFTAIGVTICAALVILGGVKRIAKFSSAVIPVMALLYLGCALFILASFWHALPAAFFSLFTSAFGTQSAVGGALGFGVMQVISTGIGRALFATDVGTGYVPILQSQAQSEHHVVDGVVALIAPFLVMVVCTLTGLVLIVTGANETSLVSTQMVVWAFQQGLGTFLGGGVVTLSLLLFGFTTILAWAFCFERALSYLIGEKEVTMMRVAFIACIPLGAFFQVGLVWQLADLALVSMTLLNLIGVAGLAKEVVLDSKLYFKTA